MRSGVIFDKNMIYGNSNDNNNDNDNNNKELNMIFRNEKIFNGNRKKVKKNIVKNLRIIWKKNL